MQMSRHLACGLLALLGCAAAARAEAPPPPAKAAPPLRLLPDQADLLVEVRQPRRLVETLTRLASLKQLDALAQVRELRDSTNYHRFQQFVAYFERELGAPWPELIDRLAGRGAVAGTKFGPNPAPSLLVVQGDDEKLTQKFFRLALAVLEQELARQDTKARPVKGSYHGIETVSAGPEFHAAAAGSTLFVSNNEKALQAGLDQYLGRTKKSMADMPGVAEAARLLPPEPLAAAWLNMENVRKVPEAKALYKMPRDDPNLTILFGGYLDLLGRTPFVCAGLHADKGGFAVTIRTPCGRDGMGPDRFLHLPPAEKPGSRPLLEPKDVLYSDSSYFDVAAAWQERKQLFNAKQAEAFEKADGSATPFLAGARLSQLLTQAGPYYRFVAVNQPKVPYKVTPKQSIPAFALVWELRKPEEFGKSMGAILRGAALLSTNQFKLKLVEEKYRDCDLVGYRFPEKEVLKADVNDIRFNFSPCFTRVGDQFVWSSTIELCRELVDLLKKEAAAPKQGDPSPAVSRLYAAGAVAYLQTIEDQLVTGTILDQAVPPKEAREQVKVFLDLVRSLGTLTLNSRYEDHAFQYEIRLRPVK